MATDSPEEAVASALSTFSVEDEETNTTENGYGSAIIVKSKQVKAGSPEKGKDITREFTDAAATLRTGELLKDEFFTLFEAVGALEIMDSKMDSGFLESGDILDDDYDVSRELLPEEVVGVMDSLLSLEVAWYMGHPLSTTIFSSVYVEKILWPEPKSIEEACFIRQSELSSCLAQLSGMQSILRAYCLAVIKTCDFVLVRIQQQTYYEEEDFCVNLYNRSLLAAFSIVSVSEVLDEALKSLGDAHLDIPDQIHKALVSRLQYRKALLKATGQDLNCSNEERSSSWRECAPLFAAVIDTHGLGVDVPESFSMKIQRRLASSVPPRPIVEEDFDSAVTFLRRLHEDGVEVENVLFCPKLSSLVTFVSIFQAKKPQTSVMIRCQLQELMFSKFDMLRKEASEVNPYFFAELKELVLPVDQMLDPANALIEAPHDDRFQISQGLDKFVQSVREPYYDFLRAFTMNRPRIRRTFCHTMLDWDGLQLELEELDSELRRYTHEKALVESDEEIWAFPLSSWAYDIKLQQMILVVQLGFELEVYHQEELAFMYWYLQYLAITRYRHTERILAFVKISRRKLRHPSPEQQTAIDRCFAVLLFNMEECLAISSLAEALCYLYLILSSLSLISPPPSPDKLSYATPHLRYALRLRPFLPLCHPPVPSIADFETQTSSLMNKLPSPSLPSIRMRPNLSPDQSRALSTLTHIDSLVRSARTGWERLLKEDPSVARCIGSEEGWRASVKDVIKSGIAVGVCVAGLRKWILAGCPKGGEAGGCKIEVPGVGCGGGTYHAWWVVPKVIAESGNTNVRGKGRNGK